MAPSRGLSTLMRTGSPMQQPPPLRRCHSQFTKAATNPSNNTQVYVSRSNDPYLNLSIEHFLLQKSPPESTILFLYTNRPCIVIGRNQNPWLEVNLGLLNHKKPSTSALKDVSLVRRRSGGGTVFHDEGNVNYSVVCPTRAFDRDKHAQMVVRALNKLGVDRAKVNERHDIVLQPCAPDDQNLKPLKISGSAYKLTRLRSVHHGTCLLSSPNIKDISKYLRSPAKPFIKARGVDSVSSPISNANVQNMDFEKAVISEFGEMYGHKEAMLISESTKDVPEIAKGLAELQSLEWTYLQTPQFTFSSYKTDEDPRTRPELPAHLPSNLRVSFTVRNGSIGQFDLSVGEKGQADSVKISFADLKTQLHELSSWESVQESHHSERRDVRSIAKWLDTLFGKASSTSS